MGKLSPRKLDGASNLIGLERVDVTDPIYSGDVTPVEVIRAKELSLAMEDLREGSYSEPCALRCCEVCCGAMR